MNQHSWWSLSKDNVWQSRMKRFWIHRAVTQVDFSVLSKHLMYVFVRFKEQTKKRLDILCVTWMTRNARRSTHEWRNYTDRYRSVVSLLLFRLLFLLLVRELKREGDNDRTTKWTNYSLLIMNTYSLILSYFCIFFFPNLRITFCNAM